MTSYIQSMLEKSIIYQKKNAREKYKKKIDFALFINI